MIVQYYEAALKQHTFQGLVIGAISYSKDWPEPYSYAVYDRERGME
jgi:hypothetical protein